MDRRPCTTTKSARNGATLINTSTLRPNHRSEDKERVKGLMTVLAQQAKKGGGSPAFSSTSLTHLLQPDLQDGGKAVVLLHLAPCSSEETIASLDWASSLKKVV